MGADKILRAGGTRVWLECERWENEEGDQVLRFCECKFQTLFNDGKFLLGARSLFQCRLCLLLTCILYLNIVWSWDLNEDLEWQIALASVWGEVQNRCGRLKWYKNICVVTHSNAAVNCKYLHDAIPVVTGGNLEEREEGHPKVFKGGVSAHSFTGVVGVTHWGKTGWDGEERVQTGEPW